jgi:hypothetical protein
MSVSRGALLLLGVLWFGLAAPQASTGAVTPTEQQLKAVFVFHFSHFVVWPPESFTGPSEPFVIGVLGSKEFAAHLEEAIRDERLDTHPLQVRHFHRIEDVENCKILYIERSEGDVLARIRPRLQEHGTLTVSDLDDAAQRGVIIQLATEDKRVRLLINTDAARSAGLTISSNLLRLATLTRTDN